MASYIFEDAPGTGGYSSVTPQQIKDALAGSGLDQSSQQSVFNTILPPAPTRSTQGSSGRYGGVDWKSILANDPFQRQLEADLSAESASDSANRSLWTEHFVTNHADMGSSRRHADLNLTAMPRIDRR